MILPGARPLLGRLAALRARVGSGGMSGGARALLDAARGGQSVRCVVRTGTRVDVGEWLRDGRVWAAVLDKELVLLANGKRPFTQRVPLNEIGSSHYNAVTGELVLARSGTETVRKLAVPPVEGWQVLSKIKEE